MTSGLLNDIRRVRAAMQNGERSPIPTDPVRFAEWVGFEPRPWQEDVLRSERQRKILCVARQLGKTEVCALLALHKALTHPGSMTLIVAPHLEQSKWLFSKVVGFFRQAGEPLLTLSDRRTGVEFSNGSRIEARTAIERTTRGFSCHLLVVEEAAGVLEPDYRALTPSLTMTGGEQLLLSTPKGRQNVFSDIWHSADGWDRHFLTAPEAIKAGWLTPEQVEAIEHEHRTLPPYWWSQEYLCEFIDEVHQVFPSQMVRDAIRPNVELSDFGDDEW